MNGVTTAYVGEILEWTGSTSSMVKYYLAGGTRVAMRNGTTLYWLIGDHLSSTSVVANSSGGLHSKMLYKAWGEVRYASASLPTRYTYTGQYSYMDDPATPGVTEGFGLMFYRSRYYDPYLNRWTSTDSIIPDLHNPFDWDRYSFVRNNPLKYVDPDGHNPLLIIAIIGATIFFSQIPSDQYQPDPANRGNPGVALFGLSLMLAPAIAPAACVNDGDCTNEANLTNQALGSVNQDGDPLNDLQVISKTAESVNDKLSRYLLNSDPGSAGYYKAKWFEQALGYTRENMAGLAKQIVFDPNNAVQTKVTEYGVHYHQWISITGVNGKVVNVKFVWIKLVDGTIKLVTAIPTKK